ncbi:MAG TPA: helicase, partial [Sphingomonadaceae bacterium]|nr:helicase [Sphingomonadaceae bacterium]
VRALLLQLVAGAGYVRRRQANLDHIAKEKRPLLRRLGITIGALDVFVPALLKPRPRALLGLIGADGRPLNENMAAVIGEGERLPSGYRGAGNQAIRLDMAERLFRAAHDERASTSAKRFRIDRALGTSMGLADESFIRLMGDAGFRRLRPQVLPDGAFGPPAPEIWSWRAPRSGVQPNGGRNRRRSGRQEKPAKRRSAAPGPGNAFAELADLIR